MSKRLLAFELLDALDAYELGNATLWALSNAFDESSGKLRDATGADRLRTIAFMVGLQAIKEEKGQHVYAAVAELLDEVRSIAESLTGGQTLRPRIFQPDAI